LSNTAAMNAAPTHLLLTGGTGFFGKALLRHWMAKGGRARPTEKVTALSRDPQAFAMRFPEFANLPWLQWHQGDIVNPDSLPQHTRFTHVLHAAADSTLGPQLSPLQRFDQILQGTRHLLNLAVRCQAHRFLLTSSGAVYGTQPADLAQIPEDWLGMPDPLLSTSSYGVAKRAAEHLCALYYQAHGLETVIARCFAFVGPDLPLNVHFAIGNFIRDALERDAITVGGDGTPLRSYLDQRDLAHWLTQLLQLGQSGQAYNVGSDMAISVADLAHLVRDTLAPGKPVQILGAPDARHHRNLYVPSIAKARGALGLEVTHSLQDAIVHTAQIAGANP
jgi:dTDP-glucose 4,6-dehydratase